MKTGKTNMLKVSKGYRLKPSTHEMIKKIQLRLDSTQDNVISTALKLYNSQLRKQLLIKIK